MDKKEFKYTVESSLELFKKAYKMVYFNNSLLRNLMLIFFILTLLYIKTSKSIGMKLMYLFIFIFIVSLFRLKPIFEYRKSLKKQEEKNIEFNEDVIKVNNRSFPTNDVKKIYENDELYLLVIGFRINVIVIKEKLDSTKEFETFILNNFKGLKKKKIYQEKNIKIQTMIQFILYLIVFSIILWVY